MLIPTLQRFLGHSFTPYYLLPRNPSVGIVVCWCGWRSRRRPALLWSGGGGGGGGGDGLWHQGGGGATEKAESAGEAGQEGEAQLSN